MSQLNYPHIASMVFNTPLFATRQAADAVKSVLVPRMIGKAGAEFTTAIATGQLLPNAFEGSEDGSGENNGLYTVAKGKVAVIPVHGLLMARRGHITNACTELVSYELIRSNISAALAAPLVEEIVLDFNTGGGMAVGCKELADFIFQAKSIKPISAIVNYAAYSAGYFLASACSKIYVSQTSGVGSIGVIIEHMEMSRWEEEVGLTFSTFFRGDHKNDGSEHEPISDQAKAEIDKRLDDAYQLFTRSVAQYRGIEQQAVIDTQAKLFSAAEALSLGLADELLSPDQAITAICLPYLQEQKPTTGLRTRARAMAISTQL